MSRVAVTGGAGYVGSVAAAHLLRSGFEVTVLDKLIYSGESLLPLLGNPGFQFIRGDIRDSGALRRAFTGAAAVVHLAGVVGEDACASDPAAAWSINVEGATAVRRAAAEAGVERFLFVSTCSNYGVSSPDTLADESVALQPLSQYAEAKVQCETMVLASAPCATVLRFGTICGLSPRMRFDLLVSEMARAAALQEPICIFRPDAWRPFLHVRDAARAVAHCLDAPVAALHGKVFNVVGENCQKQQLIRMLQKHYPGTPIEIVPKRPDLRDYRVSGERIRRELGFTTIHTVEEAFLETAQAVADGFFRDAHWPGHSAVPLDPSRLLGCRETTAVGPAE